MIEDLQLENLGVILEARIDLAPGLTAITGETGAGKTMLLTGLNLILGGKADAGAVRAGADSAVAESRIIPPAGHPALAVAADAGAVLDDDALLVVRTIVSGRSRAYLGGRSVPQAILAEVAAELVTVHGQSDQIRLRSAAHQRAALDEFAGEEHQQHLAALATAYREAVRAEEELQDWDAQAEHRERDVLALTRALERIDAAEVEPGQQAALREESERLSNVEELRIAAATAHEALSGDFESGVPGIAELLEAARSALDSARDFDPQLGQWADQLAEAGHVLSDLGVELSSYGTNLEADPARLEDVHARRALLAELSRDYAGEGAKDPDAAVLAYAERARTRLAELTEPGQGRERLEANLDQARAELTGLAETVTATRAAAAKELEDAVNSELAELAMAGATVYVTLTPTGEITSTGAEEVEFEMVANRGGARRPLAKGASGGELSRVMLALEVALAARKSGPLPTFVFDEIDAGVGGKAAVAIGRRLADLARHTQVIVVTHLAQVAAFADTHVVVTKTTTDGTDAVTNSNITAVAGEARVGELARMLSGDPNSDVARAHAAELLSRRVVAR